MLPRHWRHLLLVCLLLLGCAPEPAPATPISVTATPLRPTTIPPTPRPTDPPLVTNVPAPTAVPGALELWAVADEPRREALQRLIADAAREAGVELLVAVKSSDALLTDARARALGARPLPDLIWADQDDLGILWRDGALQPAGDGLDPGTFLPATIEGATLEGQRWGTPLAARGGLLLLSNRRITEAMPRTTDDLIVQSRQLTANDRFGLVSAWAEPRWFLAWLSGYGGRAIGPDGTPTLDTPEMIAALNLLLELRVAGPPPPSSYEQGGELFKQGRAAFAIDGEWALDVYRQQPETLDLAIAPLPGVPGTGRIAAPPLTSIYLMYSKALSGPQRERAIALGVALTSPAAQARIARDLGYIPALSAALSDPAVAENPVLAASATYAADAPGLPPLKGLRCAWGAIQAELPAMLLGDLTQEQAAHLMQTSATNCMAGPG